MFSTLNNLLHLNLLSRTLFGSEEPRRYFFDTYIDGAFLLKCLLSENHRGFKRPDQVSVLKSGSHVGVQPPFLSVRWTYFPSLTILACSKHCSGEKTYRTASSHA